MAPTLTHPNPRQPGNRHAAEPARQGDGRTPDPFYPSCLDNGSHGDEEQETDTLASYDRASCRSQTASRFRRRSRSRDVLAPCGYPALPLW